MVHELREMISKTSSVLGEAIFEPIIFKRPHFSASKYYSYAVVCKKCNEIDSELLNDYTHSISWI